MDPIRTKSVLTLDGFFDKIFNCVRPMKTVKRHLDILIFVALSVFLCSAITALGETKDVELERTINVLSGALQALTESSRDPCPICAKQTQKKPLKL